MAFDRAHSDATLTTTVTFPRKSLSARGLPYCDSVKSYNESTDDAARADNVASTATKAAASVVTRANARRRVVVASSGVADGDDTTSPFPPSTVRASRDVARVARIPRDDSTRRVADARRETFAREARATRIGEPRSSLTGVRGMFEASSFERARVASSSAFARAFAPHRSSTHRTTRSRPARASSDVASSSSWTEIIDRASSDFGSDLLVERVRDDAPNKAFAGCVILTRESVPDAVLSERRVDGARDDDVGTVGRGGVFDAFSLLPATLPKKDSTTTTTTIGILGLGAGTCARVLSAHHPGVRMVGWELDPAIVELARRHFGVDDLERAGTLRVEIGDAFAMCARDAESFDGLIVDCFDENSTVVACLRERETWEALAKKLKPGGRVIANVSTGRGRGARVEDAVACAQALADATSGEITLWRAGACGIWNELVLSGPRVDWADAEARQPKFAELMKDWFYFTRPEDASPNEPWLAKTLGL